MSVPPKRPTKPKTINRRFAQRPKTALQAQKQTRTARSTGRAQPLTQSQAKALGAAARNQQTKAKPMTAQQAKLARVKALKAKQAKAAPKRQPGSNASKLARVRALKARQAAMRNRRGRR